MAEEKQERELNRRGFLGRLGAAGALAGTGLAGWWHWRGGLASAQGSPTSNNLTPQQVQTIVRSGQPLFATYTPSGPTTRDPSAPLAITNPNILVIMVDQLRSFTPVTANDPVTQAVVDSYLPNLAALRKNSYIFPNYHVSAAMCTPSRSTIMTGLYSWQTFQLLTEGSNAVPALDSGFPTFGAALNDTRVATAYNNHVYYFGKWHLSGVTNNNPLDQYGFRTRTYPSGSRPSPNGWPNEGTNGGQWPPPGCSIPPEDCGFGQVPRYYASDRDIVDDFIHWVQGSHGSPWCAVVSLINPHDASGYRKWILDYPHQGSCPSQGNIPNFAPTGGAASLYQSGITPANYESGDTCLKPALYYVYKSLYDQTHGTVQYWGDFLNWYFRFQNDMDGLLGNIANPNDSQTILGAVNQYDSLANTVVIFTADHGEYGGAHGMHGKGGAVYQEGIHVPLYVSYPGARLGFSIPCNQLCSSVDFFPLVMELVTLNGQWRYFYPHLTNRQSLAFYLSNRNAAETRVIPGVPPQPDLPYMLHTADEIVAAESAGSGGQYAEYAAQGMGCVAAGSPIQNHVVCLRTNQRVVGASDPPAAKAKLAVYSLWGCECWPEDNVPQQFEFYDYENKGNAAEMGNDAPSAPNTPTTFCSTQHTDPTEISFCAHQGALGNVDSQGNQSGLIASELNPPLLGDVHTAQDAAKIAYRNYLRTGAPEDCLPAYSPECQQP